MQYFPVFLDATKLKVLIVGGGNIAARKLELMLKTPASIALVAPELCDRVQQLVAKHQLTWHQQVFNASLIAGKNLVVAATDIEAVNSRVYEACVDHGVLTNVVDDPERCGYITPAIIDRDPVLVAISSSGSSPVLVRMLREQFEKLMPDYLGDAAGFTKQYRELVQQRLASVAERRQFWEQVLQGDVGQLLATGDNRQADEVFHRALDNWQQQSRGSLTIIETPDGDPDNLTLAAHRQLQFADCVYFDGSTNFRMLEYVRRDADKVEQEGNLQGLEQALSDLQGERNNEQLILLLANVDDKTRGLFCDILSGVKHRWLVSGYQR